MLPSQYCRTSLISKGWVQDGSSYLRWNKTQMQQGRPTSDLQSLPRIPEEGRSHGEGSYYFIALGQRSHAYLAHACSAKEFATTATPHQPT
ncbi:hypothetical protein V5799_012515 [Amblyomma americanum]|uniref:Uncharacterized protein n=1 Tax=Amblyomma americanum TaxID=6943 RepID=A0AAQ4EDV4_AMBAM